MRYLTRIMTGLVLTLGVISDARAQVTIDVAKITCKQFRSYEITNPRNIAIWLSGYYNGKKGNTIISVDVFKASVDKVSDYCITNPTVTLMQAVDTVLSKDK